MVGVNRFASGEAEGIPVLEIDPALEGSQRRRLVDWREDRDQGRVDSALADLERLAGTDANLLPPMKTALAAGATVGEVSDTLRTVFGVYRPG